MDKEQEDKESSAVLPALSQAQSLLASRRLIIVLCLVAILGVGSGYVLTKVSPKTGLGGTSTFSTNGSVIPKGTIEGSDDLKTFKDEAVGVLEKGGIDGEGQYHLVRSGGESQNVYLISSIVDLSKYQKRKIKVWGETNTAQKAGWLMDVGRVEVLE